MSEIEISNLRKEYGIRGRKEIAVNGVDLTVSDGEFVSILGPSGCGKTTTLRCIAGLEMPTDGRVEFNGVDVTDVPANKRDLAMMFQDIALYPHMTVGQNIAYPLKIKGVGKEERREIAQDAAELMQIGDLLDKHPGALSGGQQQRTALARTIVQEPIAFLMDEPLSDLDAQLKVEIRKEIQRVHKELGKPTIYVTHDQEEAITMSDRIAILNEGEIEQVGTSREIYERPKNTFVASFIGSPTINYLEGEVVDVDESSVSLHVHDKLFDMPAPNPDVETGEEVTVGIRPQSVAVSRDLEGCHFNADIFLLEPISDEIHVTLEGPEGELRAVVRERIDLKEGQTIGVKLDASDMYLFDSTTGNLLAAAGQLNQDRETE